MTSLNLLLLLNIASLVICYLRRHFAVELIENIGPNSQHKNGCIDVPKWMQKLLHIKAKKIHKFCYYELWSAIGYAIYFPIVTVIYLVTGNNKIVHIAFIDVFPYLCFLEVLFHTIGVSILEHQRNKNIKEHDKERKKRLKNKD